MKKNVKVYNPAHTHTLSSAVMATFFCTSLPPSLIPGVGVGNAATEAAQLQAEVQNHPQNSHNESRKGRERPHEPPTATFTAEKPSSPLLFVLVRAGACVRESELENP